MKQTLNGIWNYRIGKGEWSKKHVPFSALCVGHSECQGYFDLEYDSQVILLKFDGITYNADVYLNDTYLGKMLPYSEYVFDVTQIVKKFGNSLLVKIEDIDASFGPSEGWENYGGIIRDVSIIYKSEGYIKDVFFTQELINNYSDGKYTVKASASLMLDLRITLSLEGEIVDSYITKGEEERIIKNVKVWSPDAPNLYDLRVELLENGSTVDAYEICVGFREFKCNKNHFTLNGNDIFLKGVCRHEMCSIDSGHTVTYDEIYKDMKMIKDAGCNFVRLVHYPHHKSTLDIADKLGLLVCEEPGMWQADVTDKRLTDECLEVLRRLVLRDRSHPCVAFWLAFNECDFDEDFLKGAVRVCRENDGNRLVSGANNMSNEDTKKYYNLCGLDFYTMHPYSDTFDMARRASKELCDKPLMFTEWGGYYVYNNPRLLTEFLTSMLELYENNGLCGTCLWYWAEIKDYNRGGPACVDGTLKEALVDFDRKPNLIYDAFCKAIKGANDCAKDSTKSEVKISLEYESKKHLNFKKSTLKCKEKPNYNQVLSVAKAGIQARLAKTRKKQISKGPVLEKEEIYGISRTPYLVTSSPLLFEGVGLCDKLSILGMTSLNYGYPILGTYGEDVLEIKIEYANGECQNYIAKNGVDITIAYTSVGSSRINPVAENARRAISFSYDKNFEEYIINCLDIEVHKKPISQVQIKSLNPSYNVLIYGVFK